MTDLSSLSYPIGKFIKPDLIDKIQVEKWITEIELFPQRLGDLVANLNIHELSWRDRPNGWTIKQVVHHCADSHMNSFIRFKLTLTEETPTIRPYFEDKWAELPDTTEVDISESLKLLDGLHKRWVFLLKSLSADELQKEFIHPESKARISLTQNISLYAWHCNHHLAHIKQAIEFAGKFN